MSTYLTSAITFAFDLIVKEANLLHVLKCFQFCFHVLISTKSHLNLKKKFLFILMSVLVGKLDWLFSHVFVQILYRAISEVKCVSLWVICKDGGSDPRTFFLHISC